MTTADIITALLTGLPAITAAVVAIIKAAQANDHANCAADHADRAEAANPDAKA